MMPSGMAIFFERYAFILGGSTQRGDAPRTVCVQKGMCRACRGARPDLSGETLAAETRDAITDNSDGAGPGKSAESAIHLRPSMAGAWRALAADPGGITARQWHAFVLDAEVTDR